MTELKLPSLTLTSKENNKNNQLTPFPKHSDNIIEAKQLCLQYNYPNMLRNSWRQPQFTKNFGKMSYVTEVLALKKFPYVISFRNRHPPLCFFHNSFFQEYYK